MTINQKPLKMRWGRAAGRCSLPECRRKLIEDATAADDPSVVGDNCHIVSEADDGPRANPAMPLEERNSYSNLILMCRVHHKKIDDQVNEFTIARLQKIKEAHEDWVRATLDFDAKLQADEEQYAGILDHWVRLAHIDHWLAWSSHVMSNGQPSLWTDVDKDLFKLREWMLTRVWPDRYPSVQAAFGNFARVLCDFQEVFRGHAKPYGDGDVLWTEKFYKINEWNEERFARGAARFDFHVDLVQDLMLELTRAGNLVCDRVRETFLPAYRLAEGRLMTQSGPNIRFEYDSFVPQYTAAERINDTPYPGLEAFFTQRATRDRHYGSTAPNDESRP